MSPCPLSSPPSFFIHCRPLWEIEVENEMQFSFLFSCTEGIGKMPEMRETSSSRERVCVVSLQKGGVCEKEQERCDAKHRMPAPRMPLPSTACHPGSSSPQSLPACL